MKTHRYSSQNPTSRTKTYYYTVVIDCLVSFDIHSYWFHSMSRSSPYDIHKNTIHIVQLFIARQPWALLDTL